MGAFYKDFGNFLCVRLDRVKTAEHLLLKEKLGRSRSFSVGREKRQQPQMDRELSVSVRSELCTAFFGFHSVLFHPRSNILFSQ